MNIDKEELTKEELDSLGRGATKEYGRKGTLGHWWMKEGEDYELDQEKVVIPGAYVDQRLANLREARKRSARYLAKLEQDNLRG